MKVRYLSWLILLMIFSCKKDQSSDNSKSSAEFKFTAIYDSVITISANSTFSFVFTINVASGDIAQNTLNCSIAGLPQGITVTPATINVGVLKGGVFSLVIGDVPVGTDTILFQVNSAKYGLQTHKLLLKVAPPPDNAPLLAGTYPASYDYCIPADSFYYYTSVVSTVPDTLNLIKISNIKKLGSGFVVRAWVNQAVSIPVQTIGAYKIWGTGTFIHDSNAVYHLIINDTLVQGLDTQSCTIHIQH